MMRHLRRIVLGATIATACGGSFGCTSAQKTPQTARPQAAEDTNDRELNGTIGTKTAIDNIEPLQVSAVGLVYGLSGTGSAASGEWRGILERELRKKKVTPSQFLDDPNNTCSLVLVSALIPAGAKKGDTVDIDVVLPRGSRTTSLKGGTLFECDLSTSEMSGNVREQMVRSGMDVGNTPPVSTNTLLVGKMLVRAEGPLVAGVMEKSARVKAKVVSELEDSSTTTSAGGRVWGGGVVKEDRPYWFVLNEKDQNTRTAMEIAARLNSTFMLAGDSRNKVANAVTKQVVTVNIPPAYRLNHQRFLIVSRQVPMVPAGPESLYRKKLEQELLDPETAVVAAVKLEALGAESTRPLQTGLQSSSPWVRFASAEALAYLGSTSGAGELAKLAEQHPALRSHALLALASIDDGVSTDRLVELMRHPDPTLRYGAFTALRSANELHPELQGKRVRDQFWVHQVASGTKELVHLAGSRRTEIVLFGGPIKLVAPFTIPLGNEFVIAAKAGDETATITHLVSGSNGTKERTVKVPLNLANILATVGELGGSYSDAVELVQRTESTNVLTASVSVDALPRGIPTTQLAQLARSDSNLERANIEVTRATTPGNDIQLASFDLPSEGDTVKKTEEPEIALNRSPGRLFAPKPHPQEAELDRPTPTAPKSVESSSGDLARSPGRLFGRN